MVRDAGFQYMSYPIVDMCVPEEFVSAIRFIEDIVKQLNDGERILLHCRCASAHHALSSNELDCTYTDADSTCS